MFIVNGIAYATTPVSQRSVIAVKVLDDRMMILTFASGEKRLFDATRLFRYPAFEPLKDEAVFRAVRIDRGVVTWSDGEIDIAPETMYAESTAYEELPA